MNKILELIGSVWQVIPDALRKPLRTVITIGLVIGIAISVVMMSWLVWNTGVIQDQFSGLATKDDLTEQTDDIAEGSAVLVDTLLSQAIAEYDVKNRAYMANERKLAVDTLLIPVLMEMKKLREGISQLSARQKTTDQRVQLLPLTMDAKLERVLQKSDPKYTEQLLRDVLEEIADLKAANDTLRAEMKNPRRTTKQRF